MNFLKMKYQIILKTIIATVLLMLYVCLCSCDEMDVVENKEFSNMQSETQSEKNTTAFSEVFLFSLSPYL